MPEVSFEQKFGQLVDAQINEKLPSLVKYRVGFQVVDKNDDETKAVGVAAFILNNVWLYIPSFFLNGDLKGLDLLYHKQQDLFIPAMDNWIKTLEEQGKQTLGFMRDSANLMNNDEFDAPEDTVVYEGNTDLGKSASLGYDSLIDRPTYERMMVNYGFQLPIKNVLDEIPQLGKTAAASFVHNLASNADYFSAFLPFYELPELHKTARECTEVATPAPTVNPESAVQFYNRQNMKEASEDLNDSSKKLLIEHGLYIKDNRKDFSKVFQIEIDSSILQNPAHPGIYDCFMRDGTYKTMVVLFPKLHDQRNANFSRHESNVGRDIALIDVTKPKEYIRKKNKDVFCRPATNLEESKYSRIEGGTKASARSLRDLKPGTKVLFVKSPKYSIESHIVGHVSNGRGGTMVTLSNSAGDGLFDRGLNKDHCTNELLIEFVGPDVRLAVHGDKLFIPEGTKLFTSKAYSAGTDTNPWARPESIYQIMHKQAGLHKVQLFSQGNTAHIKSPKGHTGLLTKEAAIRHLVLEQGIEAGQAVQIYKEASRSERGEKAFFIKYAGPYDTGAYGDSERPFQGGPSGKQEYAEKHEVTTSKPKDLSGAQSSDNNPIMPQQVIDKALAASEAGIKEVFDTKVLQGLVEKSDISELRKDYIVDITKGMDKIGRMLFLFYWHNDEFEEKYGKDDMKHLEDTLREVFFSTGDLVLFLKEKTAYNPDSAESLFGSLSEGISGADGDSE